MEEKSAFLEIGCRACGVELFLWLSRPEDYPKKCAACGAQLDPPGPGLAEFIEQNKI